MKRFVWIAGGIVVLLLVVFHGSPFVQSLGNLAAAILGLLLRIGYGLVSAL